METLKLFTAVFLVASAYLFVGYQDYHDRFDKPTLIRYNCDMLIGGWHPDIPREVIEKCRTSERNHVYIKSNQE